MKKMMFVVAALAALGGMGYFGTWVSAQQSNVAPAAATNKPTLKIGVINLAKVLKNFDKANYMGESLLKDAQAKENQVKQQQALLLAEEAKAGQEVDMAKRDAQLKNILNQKRALDDQMTEFRKLFSEKQADMAVTVNKELTAVVDSIAKTYGLELMLTYPDVTGPEEIGKPADAFRKLSSPATMVAWCHPGLDMTDTVIATLNKYFPKPAGAAAPAAPTPTGTNR